jgi:hypothetical protein
MPIMPITILFHILPILAANSPQENLCFAVAALSLAVLFRVAR